MLLSGSLQADELCKMQDSEFIRYCLALARANKMNVFRVLVVENARRREWSAACVAHVRLDDEERDDILTKLAAYMNRQ